MSLSAKVESILIHCLYKAGEIVDGTSPPDGAILAEGIVQKFAFHPERLEKNREKVIEILKLMNPNFHVDSGRGWSFLNLAFTKDGEHWGEHRDCEHLLCLAIALGLAKYMLPRDHWDMFPGGMPYLTFDVNGIKKEEEK